MLILKYSKTGDAKYISHVDTLRVFVRTLRRMGIAVEYSKGFNPHMLLNMSPPLPVGIESKTEFVEITTDAATEGFIELFNKNCPEGIIALQVFKTEKTPHITAKTTAAEYEAEVNSFDTNTVISGQPKLFAFTAEKDKLVFTIACGNNNLRPDRFLESIGVNPKDIKITRTKLYAGESGKLVLIDDII